MRSSAWLTAALKETPHDAEIVSHQLMLRAGMIRKIGSGLYTWLPMGLKVLRNVERIVREEMNRAGALEVLMPSIQPAELWQETGRWETFGGQLLTMKDSNGRDYCYGPTHEEVITDLMRNELHSYKQLPLTLYQIQTKFRDEIRPRFGVMRAREFIMKDAYSFHLSLDSLQATYDAMFQAYSQIFNRLGLKFRAVEADTGAIGGAVSHEFQVLADSGEDLLFYSSESDYAANSEQATSLAPLPAALADCPPMLFKETPSQKTISEITDFLSVTACQTVKTLLVEGTEQPLIALVLRGDDTINPLKAAKHPWVKSPLTLASDELIEQTLAITPGFVGPMGLSIPVIADHIAAAMPQFICGANKPNQHALHVVWNRDATFQAEFDMRQVKEGDPSPDGLGVLCSCRGIEVGHIFQLGSKYANAMKAEVLDESGQLQTMLMGCYGIGISRIVAASIEQHHDEKGIRWPDSLAPFKLVIIPVNAERAPAIRDAAEALYQRCLQLNIDVLLDDSNERPGVLFAKSDLTGIPHRLVVSERNWVDGLVEYKSRTEDTPRLLSSEELTDLLSNI